jgi:response regulator of citrate/malate metabolism
MNVERVRLEMTDYLQKRQILAENGDLVRKQIEIIVKVTKKRQQEAREIKQVF